MNRFLSLRESAVVLLTSKITDDDVCLQVLSVCKNFAFLCLDHVYDALSGMRAFFVVLSLLNEKLCLSKFKTIP